MLGKRKAERERERDTVEKRRAGLGIGWLCTGDGRNVKEGFYSAQRERKWVCVTCEREGKREAKG